MKRLQTSIYSILLMSAVYPLTGLSITLNDVVVTAQKREQHLEDVPTSVQVVETVEYNLHSNNLPEKDNHILSAHFGESIVSPTLFIRGMGTPPGIGLEQSVAIFIDDVYFGRSAQSLLPLYDVERIEVMRGPQSTYFGQNAIAGAVNVINRKPDDSASGYVFFTVGSDGEYNQSFAYGAPVSDTLSLRFATHFSQLEGYLNDGLGGEAPERGSESFRFSGLWTPIEDFSLDFKLEQRSLNEQGPIYQLQDCKEGALTACTLAMNDPNLNVDLSPRSDTVYMGGRVAAPPIINFNGVDLPTIDYSSVTSIFDQDQRKIESQSALLKSQYDWDNFSLTSVSAVSRYYNDDWVDIDGTPYALLEFYGEEDYEQWSQELRLASTTAESLDWMFGLYYQYSDVGSGNTLFSAFDNSIPSIGGATSTQNNEKDHWASAFLALNYHFNDRLSANIGARYTYVKKTAKSTVFGADLDPNVNAIPELDKIRSGNKVSFNDGNFNTSFGLQWYADADTMLYGQYSESFKAGGFGGVGDIQNPGNIHVFDSEVAKSVELGMKRSLFDSSVDLNIALFNTNYSDLQVSTIDGSQSGFLVNNAADASSLGLELETAWHVSERLSLSFSAAFMNAKYDSFSGSACNPEEIRNSECGENGTRDRKGDSLLYAPDWQLALQTYYQHPLNDSLNLSLMTHVSYKDDYVAGVSYSDAAIQDRHENVDFRLALQPFTSSWQVALYGKNITDQRALDDLTTSILHQEENFATYTRGSSYGVEGRFDF